MKSNGYIKPTYQKKQISYNKIKFKSDSMQHRGQLTVAQARAFIPDKRALYDALVRN